MEMVAPEGFAPPLTGSEPVVLLLHHGAMAAPTGVDPVTPVRQTGVIAGSPRGRGTPPGCRTPLERFGALRNRRIAVHGTGARNRTGVFGMETRGNPTIRHPQMVGLLGIEPRVFTVRV